MAASGDPDEKLAELVRSYPALYDKSLPDFKNARKKELAWVEIAKQMGLNTGRQKHKCYDLKIINFISRSTVKLNVIVDKHNFIY